MGGYLGTAELELLDDVGYLFEAMRVAVRVSFRVRDHEECRLLEEQHLIAMSTIDLGTGNTADCSRAKVLLVPKSTC